METRIVGIVAAMPGEIRPLLKIAGKCSKTKVEGFNLYNFNIGGKSCRLIESGIGMGKAARAMQTLIGTFRPEVIISFGFCGALLPGMSVGDLTIAGRTFLWGESFAKAGETIDLSVPTPLLPTLEKVGGKFGFSVRQSDFLTSNNILNKKELRALLPVDMTNPVLDMETWAIAREAVREKVPLLAIRAVSDASDEELEFSLDRFMDREMNIRVSKILLAIVSKPGILPQLIRLAGNSRVAGRNLAIALQELLQTDAALI